MRSTCEAVMDGVVAVGTMHGVVRTKMSTYAATTPTTGVCATLNSAIPVSGMHQLISEILVPSEGTQKLVSEDILRIRPKAEGAPMLKYDLYGRQVLRMVCQNQRYSV